MWRYDWILSNTQTSSNKHKQDTCELLYITWLYKAPILSTQSHKSLLKKRYMALKKPFDIHCIISVGGWFSQYCPSGGVF